MLDLAQNTVEGLMIGSSYALLALGFTLIFGVMRRLNLAYGASIMLALYAATFLHVQHGLGALAVAAVAVVGAALVGAYVERLCFAPMGPGADIAAMVSSFAIWMQLEQAAVLLLPRHTYPFPTLAGGTALEFGPFLVRPEHLLMLASASGLVLALHLALYRSRAGLALRAVIDSPVAAHLAGIPVRRIRFVAFALASAVGGVAGVLILAADGQVTPMFGMWATLKGLVAMMIGGLGSLPGALAGGLFLGVVEMQGQYFFGPQARDLIAFVLLFAVLVLRPGGILGCAGLRSR